LGECGRLKQLKPFFDEFAGEFPQVAVLKLSSLKETLHGQVGQQCNVDFGEFLKELGQEFKVGTVF
jgi:hypothetical protein